MDKIRGSFSKKSLDQEIDEAFDDSNSYSKKVLEGHDKFGSSSRSEDTLSNDYFNERPAEAQQPFMDQQRAPVQFDGNQAYPERDLDITDPLKLPPESDREPPRLDAPLNRIEDRPISDNERRDFLNKSTFSEGRAHSSSSSGDAGMRDIMLELKDIRTQNEHILDILKNVQERLRRY